MQTSTLNLASLVRTVRKRAGISQIELAGYADVSRGVVQGIESGETTASWENVLKVLAVLNIAVHLESPIQGDAGRGNS